MDLNNDTLQAELERLADVTWNGVHNTGLAAGSYRAAVSEGKLTVGHQGRVAIISAVRAPWPAKAINEQFFRAYVAAGHAIIKEQWYDATCYTSPTLLGKLSDDHHKLAKEFALTDGDAR